MTIVCIVIKTWSWSPEWEKIACRWGYWTKHEQQEKHLRPISFAHLHLPECWGWEALAMHKGHRWPLNLFVIATPATAVPGLTACKAMGLVQMSLATDETLAVLSKAEVPKFSKDWIVFGGSGLQNIRLRNDYESKCLAKSPGQIKSSISQEEQDVANILHWFVWVTRSKSQGKEVERDVNFPERQPDETHHVRSSSVQLGKEKNMVTVAVC